MRIFLYAGLIFTVLNLFVFCHLRAAFGGGGWQWAVLGLMAVMVLLFTRRRGRLGPFAESVVQTLVFTWTGFLLVSAIILSDFDLVMILALTVDLGAGTRLGSLLGPARAIPWGLGASALACVYAVGEGLAVRTTRITIPTHKLPQDVTRLRIAAFADAHSNRIAGSTWRIRRLVRLLAKTEADLIVCLGDFVDTDLDEKTPEADCLRSLSARLGKLAVLGNHEAYNGVRNAVDFLASSGFTVLRNQCVPAGALAVCGMDDPALFQGGVPEEKTACAALLRDAAPGRDGPFILLLRHRPGLAPELAGLFDLQLSGHTHDGQIWQAKWLIRKIHGISRGLTTVRGPHGHSLVYVSSGCGVWGPPVRFLARPEIAVIDLIQAQRGDSYT